MLMFWSRLPAGMALSLNIALLLVSSYTVKRVRGVTDYTPCVNMLLAGSEDALTPCDLAYIQSSFIYITDHAGAL